MTESKLQLNTNAADVSENDLRERYPEILKVLLRDHTTGKNIFWATRLIYCWLMAPEWRNTARYSREQNINTIPMALRKPTLHSKIINQHGADVLKIHNSKDWI